MTQQLFAVDTSVALPLLLLQHPQNPTVDAWSLDKKLCLTAHSLAETYSVLTRLNAGASISPEEAVRLIDGRFSTVLTLDELTAASVHRHFAEQKIGGGAVYDGLVALAAKAHGAILATRDTRARGTYAALGVETVVIASR